MTLARQARVDALGISDANGVIIASTNPSSIGFRFSEDPHHQSSVFRSLLNQRDGIVTQPIQARDQDGKPYVYVGVSRRDCPGIVEAGTSGDVVYRLGGYSRGFAVVAGEIRKLAEHAKVTTKEIAILVRGIQRTVSEAVVLMEDSAREVKSGTARATESGNSLAAIFQAAESVNQQVTEIAAAVQDMNTSSNELVHVMASVRTVVDENTTAAEEMTAGSREMTRQIENIAGVSEGNSAATEEVSASVEEMSAQVEEVTTSAQSLAEMAEALQLVVAQFKLAPEQRQQPIEKSDIPKQVQRWSNNSVPVHRNNGHSPVKVL
jgi:methyl-accepting chemotaxis protein